MKVHLKEQEAISVKVKFQYRISGKPENGEGEISGEGKDYDASMKNAYENLCAQQHNQYLTVTFRKMA